MIKILEELNRQNISLIVVTHDPELGGRANRRITMADGMILSDQARQAAT